MSATTSKICKNCNQTLQGTYCHHCGEKVVEESDFHFKTLVGESLGTLFNVDSKIFKSFHYLLLKPGRLTKYYVDGVRKPFMKPIQLFLVINVLFFFLLTQADILRIPSKYYFLNAKSNSLTAMSQQTGISELDLSISSIPILPIIQRQLSLFLFHFLLWFYCLSISKSNYFLASTLFLQCITFLFS